MKGVDTGIRTLRKTARCLDCPKRWDGPNALAVAARHTAAHGHTCMGETSTVHTYAPARPPWN